VKLHGNDSSPQYCLIHSLHITNQHGGYLPHQDLSGNTDAKLRVMSANYIATKQTRKAECVRHVASFQPVYLTTDSPTWDTDTECRDKRISNGVLLHFLCCISTLSASHTAHSSQLAAHTLSHIYHAPSHNPPSAQNSP
jgi:hypothetical protein